MSLVSLLATTTLITLATSTPMILADDVAAAGPVGGGAGQRAKIPVDHDHFLLIMLLNRRDFGLKTKPPLDETGGEYITSLDSDMSGGGGGGFDTGGIAVSDVTRGKRIGSLSIVNSVDVLRERVLLELARRKAMEDQRQISENRRILNSVGKRGFSYRDHRIARKKRLQYQLNHQQQPERLLAQ